MPIGGMCYLTSSSFYGDLVIRDKSWTLPLVSKRSYPKVQHQIFADFIQQILSQDKYTILCLRKVAQQAVLFFIQVYQSNFAYHPYLHVFRVPAISLHTMIDHEDTYYNLSPTECVECEILVPRDCIQLSQNHEMFHQFHAMLKGGHISKPILISTYYDRNSDHDSVKPTLRVT